MPRSASGRVRMCTPMPPSHGGSLPFHGSLAGRQVTRIGSTPSVSLGAASTAAIRPPSRAPFPGGQPPLIGTPRFDTHLLFTARRRRALRRWPWPLGLERVWLRPRVGGGGQGKPPPADSCSPRSRFRRFRDNEAATRLTSGCDCQPGEL